jgi:hypothetical protein
MRHYQMLLKHFNLSSDNLNNPKHTNILVGTVVPDPHRIQLTSCVAQGGTFFGHPIQLFSK